MDRYKNTTTWKTAFSQRDDDQHASQRSRLASSFEVMRDHVKHLVSKIDAECHGLTVHDVTHLDALWEMADLISGGDGYLNPAETFVFGAAVLIHDSSMTVSAYGGLDAIKATIEWKDVAGRALRKMGIQVNPDSIQNPPESIRDEIIFTTLRNLHAGQAEELVRMEWNHPSDQHTIRLLEDSQLLEGLGSSIGKVAHSHHWSLDKVVSELREMVGAGPGFPPQWTINEVKVACLLRCADAAHIDFRRAPSMLFALNRPTGLSKDHWSFQNKLNQPTKSSGRLVYTSQSAFGLSEVDAWWLCIDTIKMIDREIAQSNNILLELDCEPFVVSGVLASDNVVMFSRHVKTSGWAPVDAEIRVSDPIHLARTLGGRNLYGAGALPPIRELLQNGVDAVRALRRLEAFDDSWGLVSVTVSSRDGEVWLDVEDNGLGMSQRVLTGPLLDFGKSFWSSSLLQQEFPGLESRGISPIGKFGIGFFSIFSLGEEVKVVSRRHDAGVVDAKVVEFKSLSRRPIVRAALAGEASKAFSTKVSVKLDVPELVASRRDQLGNILANSIYFQIRRLVATLDVSVKFVDQISDVAFEHKPNWKEQPAAEFLADLLVMDKNSILISEHANMLRNIVDQDGGIHGRAALKLPVGDAARSTLFASIGGFVSAGVAAPGGYDLGRVMLGVVSAEVETAARIGGKVAIAPDVLAAWSSDQVRLIDRDKFTQWDLVQVAHRISELGGDPGDLPFAFVGGGFVSKGELVNIISSESEILVPLSKNYKDMLEISSFKDLKPMHFLLKPKGNIVFSMRSSVMHKDLSAAITERVLAKQSLAGEDVETVKATFREDIEVEWALIDKVWGVESKIEISEATLYDDIRYGAPQKSWVLILRKP